MPRKVLFGTPAHDGRNDVEFTSSMVSTARLLMHHGIDMRELLFWGSALVQDTRNDIVKVALEKGYDDLIFCDSDQDWKPEWVLKLLSYPVDCVGAAVRKRTEEERYNVKAKSYDIPRCPKTGLMIVEALGCGFLRFSRRALQVLWDNSPPYRAFGNEESRWIFDVRPVDGELVGEDTMVSLKLKAHGIQTYLDPTMVCGHVGRKRYHGDFLAYLERMKALQPKQEAAE